MLLQVQVQTSRGGLRSWKASQTNLWSPSTGPKDSSSAAQLWNSQVQWLVFDIRTQLLQFQHGTKAQLNSLEGLEARVRFLYQVTQDVGGNEEEEEEEEFQVP